ncbi:uncharacterized protein BDW43DRAFT_293716, partial [Aspergillus alliaceus]|uniref:uncharacterized protein n=1 Tax=Petromyces alliaceus TaxID=209559 RepID=UPI0012A41DB2
MAKQLAFKLPKSTRPYVYDVVEEAMNDIVSKYTGKVVAGSSPMDVAEHPVSRFEIYYDTDIKLLTHHQSCFQWYLRAHIPDLYT